MEKTPRDALAADILDLLALAPAPELDRVLDRGRRQGRFGAAGRRALAPIAGSAGVAIANVQLYERAQSLAVVEERTRVARELHDAASQRLFSLVYEAHAAALRSQDPEASAALGPIEAPASEAPRGLRGLCHALRPNVLDA